MRTCFWTTFWCLLLALPGCGETFTASGGGGSGGGSGGGGSATSNQGGGGTGAQGGGGTSVSTGGGATCGPNEANECDVCLADACAESYCPCAEGTSCFKLLDCYASSPATPPLPSYVQACWQKNGDAIAAAGNLLACGGEACKGPCNLLPVDPCTACLYESCPGQVDECFSLFQCTELLRCLGDCAPGDGPCASDCTLDHQAGVTPASALDSCSKAHCAEVCPK